ncbi:MAG: hypothetical protein EOP10_29965 [Proteobacteria bacterium]|nr:MAG: hypothetical protein EOP10_29965 [Pseudomonadota bacterium]
MKKITELKSRNLRHDRNSELVRRMRNGEQLTSFNSQSSWYPPRPIIEKDQTAISKLYGRAAKALKPDALRYMSEMSIDVQETKDSHLQLAD